MLRTHSCLRLHSAAEDLAWIRDVDAILHLAMPFALPPRHKQHYV